MAIHGIGPIMQDLHSLRYPLRSREDLLAPLAKHGDIYIKGRHLREVASRLRYPIYTPRECIDRLIDAASALGAAKGAALPRAREREPPRPTGLGLYEIRPSPRGTSDMRASVAGAPSSEISRAAEGRGGVRSYAGDVLRLRESEEKVKALKGIAAESAAKALVAEAREVGVTPEKEFMELELKAAIARLKLEKEEQMRARLELEAKKKELELEYRERERELRGKFELELRKKELELESREAERELRNRAELELRKKELELDLKKKELELENTFRARVQVAVKEREDELRQKIRAEFNAELERLRKSTEEELKRREELLRKRLELEQRERAAAAYRR